MNAVERKDDDDAVPHPRETAVLVGHESAERTLLDAYRSGRVPHAWLIGGPTGIGKATLAYRFARFVLVHPDPAAPLVQEAQTLAVDPQHRAARRIAAQAHPDMIGLERTLDDKDKLRTVITVEQVRDAVRFFGSTAGEGGWRVVVVDTFDELKHPEAPNALLKVLEEPPPRALLLLVSHAPGRVLPTVRSRCRQLALRPLFAADVARAAAHALGHDPAEDNLKTAAAAAEGSVARALGLLQGPMLELRGRVTAQLDLLPRLDPLALHEIGDAIGGADPAPLAAFVDSVNSWLSAQLAKPARDLPRLMRVAQAWETINRSARETDSYNLERKPLVFTAFGLLAEAARG